MTITLNGKSSEVDADITILELLRQTRANHLRVVVERNGTIVKRAAFPTTTLAEGDRLEVISFVGGG